MTDDLVAPAKSERESETLLSRVRWKGHVARNEVKEYVPLCDLYKYVTYVRRGTSKDKTAK